MTTTDLIAIINTGVSIKISASDHTTTDLILIANSLTKNAKLHLTNAKVKTKKDLILIANTKPDQILFEL